MAPMLFIIGGKNRKMLTYFSIGIYTVVRYYAQNFRFLKDGTLSKNSNQVLIDKKMKKKKNPSQNK